MAEARLFHGKHGELIEGQVIAMSLIGSRQRTATTLLSVSRLQWSRV